MSEKKKKKSGKNRSITLIALAVCMAGAIACLNYYGTFHYRNIVSNPPEKGVVKIYRNFSYEDLCEAMTSSGVLDNNRTFRLAAGNRHLHRYYNFAGWVVETVPRSLHHSCRSELTRQGISLP